MKIENMWLPDILFLRVSLPYFDNPTFWKPNLQSNLWKHLLITLAEEGGLQSVHTGKNTVLKSCVPVTGPLKITQTFKIPRSMGSCQGKLSLAFCCGEKQLLLPQVPLHVKQAIKNS